MMLRGELKKNRIGTEYIESDGNPIAKSCRKCGEMKAIGLFPKDKTGFCGVRAICSECNSLRCKAHYRKTEEYQVKRARKYRENNLEKVVESRRRRYEDNRMLEIERSLSWKKENKAKVTITKSKRRAHEKTLPHTITEEEMKESLSFFSGKCALTGRSVELHWDHFIPLSTGQGGTTKGNLIPISAHLNMSKGSRSPFAWFESNEERFSLCRGRFDRVVAYLANANSLNVKEYKDYVERCFFSKEEEVA